jgi:hypothetical protein
MKKDLKKFIRECEVCQKMKHENISLAGFSATTSYSNSNLV